MSLKDVSHQFTFRAWTLGPYSYKEAKGELGVPGQVSTYRTVADQRLISRGSGEHAGHLIGIQFGAPGDLRNLGLQNPNTNTFAPKALQPGLQGAGGSYHNLESRWSEALKEGTRVTVTVTDKYHYGESRPFSRAVEWSEAGQDGVFGAKQRLEFANFGSPQSRAQIGR